MNRHASRHRILSATCLPFHHSGILLILLFLRVTRKLEAATGIEPVVRVLQTRALPLGYAAVEKVERKTGFEPATPTLARSYSTTELLPKNWAAGLTNQSRIKVRCLTAWLYPKKQMGRTEGNRTPECRNHNPMR